MKRLLLGAGVVSALFLGSISPVIADTTECSTSAGQYGETTTTCKKSGESVVVAHAPVQSGLGDVSFWTVAQVLALVGIAFFTLAKYAETKYWFD